MALYKSCAMTECIHDAPGVPRAGFDFGQGEESNYFLQGEHGYHQQWDSRLYNYKNWEVLRYLLSNVRWWLDEFQ